MAKKKSEYWIIFLDFGVSMTFFYDVINKNRIIYGHCGHPPVILDVTYTKHVHQYGKYSVGVGSWGDVAEAKKKNENIVVAVVVLYT